MKLTEVIVPANDQMTYEQQRALLSIYLAQSTSPAAAAEALKGSDKKMAAGEYLLTKRFITTMLTGVQITQLGAVQLVNLGLIQQGQVTPKGRELIDGPEGGQNDGSREVGSAGGGAPNNQAPRVPGNQPQFNS